MNIIGINIEIIKGIKSHDFNITLSPNNCFTKSGLDLT